jgi:glutamate carboxypeptidase
MTEALGRQILGYLNNHKAEMIAFLRILVLLESPSRVSASQEPILKALEERIDRLNYDVKLMPGKKAGGYLFARPQERIKKNPIQLIVGHCDTVWDIGTLQEMPFSEGADRIKGPGVYDMKAGLTQIVFALEAMMALYLTPKITPVILINSDEEIGSRESTSTIQRLARMARRAFVLEPPLGLDGKLKTARKGLGRFTIKVKGKAAHAGLDPGAGVNAIVELSHQIQRLFAMNDLENGISVNVGMIEGGISANVVAPESMAVVDVRVLTKEDGDHITDQILNLEPTLSGTELRIEGGIGRPPMQRTERNVELWQVAKSQGKWIGLDLEEGTAGGGSDGNTTSLYTATLDGLGTIGDGAHADHEFIFSDKLIERTALLTLLLLAD